MPGLREMIDVWASLYASSPATRTAVTFSHLGALVVGGGSAIAADLGTLRALRRDGSEIRAELERVGRTHRRVVASLAVIVASGVLLALADLDAYLASPAFWIKMGAFAVLLANGALLAASAGRDVEPRTRLRLRVAAVASVALWLATTLLGTVVPNVL